MSFSDTFEVSGRRAPARRPAWTLRVGFVLSALTLFTLPQTAFAAPEPGTTAIETASLSGTSTLETLGSTRRWLGPDDQPLPFATDAEIVDFLQHADVIQRKVLSSGSTKPTKVLLEKDGVRANAIFRTVDVKTGKGHRAFKDCYHFEVAAYETARLLGLDNVPPAVERRLDGKSGSMQLWVENARSETERIAEGGRHKSMSKIIFQKHTMRVFDQLIYNFDRNTGNVLVDDDGKLWMIDHTRAFKAKPILPKGKAVEVLHHSTWQRLQNLDVEILEQRLGPHLDPLQMAALLKRHQLLVEYIEQRIETLGEDQVLFGSV